MDVYGLLRAADAVPRHHELALYYRETEEDREAYRRAIDVLDGLGLVMPDPMRVNGGKEGDFELVYAERAGCRRVRLVLNGPRDEFVVTGGGEVTYADFGDVHGDVPSLPPAA